MNMFRLIALSVFVAFAGCSTYKWTSQVPQDCRTVFVANFINNSDVTGLGNVAARQVARELMREGTFRIATSENCALEIQGVINSADSNVVSYNRHTGVRNFENRLSVVATVTFIDRKNGRILLDNRKYESQTTFLYSGDLVTAQKDASGRVAEDLARQITDDALNLKWE